MPETPDPVRRFAALPGALNERLFSQIALIRRFEQRLLELFEENAVFGTTHCYIGQEANAAGILNHLRAGDIVFSNHRCHGHFLVYADRPGLLMAELMGRDGGVVSGRGGSQHLCYGDFYSNGVQGGITPNAVGMALAEKMRGTGAIAVVFLGDGTLGQGVVYEALNMASLWGAPVLFVVEDNGWAQSTPSSEELAGDMVARGEAFGIAAGEITSTDAEELYAHFKPIINRVRTAQRPHFEVVHTYRLCHHSKSDDMRPKEEVAARWADEPLAKLQQRLDQAVAGRLLAEANARVLEAESWARARPFPPPSSLDGARSKASRSGTSEAAS